MNSYSNNPAFEFRQMLGGLIAYHQEGLKRVVELQQTFDSLLDSPDLFRSKPNVNKQEFVAFADGTGLTREAFSKINENDFDIVLGLDLKSVGIKEETPLEVKALCDQRDQARAEKNFEESDRLRDKIENMGYTVEDTSEGTRVFKK